MKKEYKSAKDFRQAIQSKFKQLSKDQGLSAHNLHRRLAYERFLARLFQTKDIEWLLKGGHALELRLQESRVTKDMDLSLKEMKIFGNDPKKRNLAILGLLQESSRIDLGDFFVFRVEDPVMDLDGPPYGGARFPVIASVANKVFHTFSVDVGVGDSWIEPHDELKVESLLDFAGFENIKIPLVNVGQHFAEKIHAYTLPRKSGFNSRVKDLVDMVLLAEEMGRPTEDLWEALDLTFKKRATHDFSKKLSPPPEEWDVPFKKYMRELGRDLSLKDAFKLVQDFLNLS